MSKLELCFDATMDMEGRDKFVVDEGGPTKYGVSLRGCRDQIGDKDGDGDIDADDVKLLTKEDALEIFREKYYNPMNADHLPAPIALLAVDFAYNGGPAAKALQKILGVKADGKIGGQTIKAAETANVAQVIDDYCAARLEYLKGLAAWPKYEAGWTNRVKKAKRWATHTLEQDA